MKRSEMLTSLARYLVKKDQHLALSMVQARTLADHALKLVEKEGMTMLSWKQLTRSYGMSMTVENQGTYGWEDET